MKGTIKNLFDRFRPKSKNAVQRYEREAYVKTEKTAEMQSAAEGNDKKLTELRNGAGGEEAKLAALQNASDGKGKKPTELRNGAGGKDVKSVVELRSGSKGREGKLAALQSASDGKGKKSAELRSESSGKAVKPVVELRSRSEGKLAALQSAAERKDTRTKDLQGRPKKEGKSADSGSEREEAVKSGELRSRSEGKLADPQSEERRKGAESTDLQSELEKERKLVAPQSVSEEAAKLTGTQSILPEDKLTGQRAAEEEKPIGLQNTAQEKEIDPDALFHKPQRGVKLQALDEIEGFSVRPGFYNRDGATATSNGVSFTIHSFGATSCTLLLFHPQEKEPYAKLKFPDAYHIGNTYSMLVFGLKIEEFEYAFQLDGPYDREKGLLFNEKHILLDPYAKAVTGQREWGERPESGKGFVYHARVVENNFDWGKGMQLEYPLEDLIIYEMHVRGFTKDESSGVTAKGTYEGLRQKIPYLKDLGVNAVELMPIFEFDEMENARVVDGVQLYNYWGYNTVCFFAPNTGYSSVVEHNHEGDELKQMIYELKENGIEVILDVVFNHTAEGNENGPCFSFKGIDNNIYYILTPDGYYYNFSGCGNVLNCNHPMTRRFIIDCLRYWVTEYRVDGFRFDLASILTRDQDGAPMAEPPILQAIASDTILGKTKLIAEAWDAGGLYQVGNFPAYRRWSEWNGRYRDDMRRFLKGDEGMAGTAITRITGSKDLYDPSERGKSASVNFLTCHDGFTLYDMYSYNIKHNEKNGWDNTDGDNNLNSWNCGTEGATDDPKIEGLRRRMVKNAFATLMCSRGPAMFFAGDEFCNTQFGNNNAYCQDNIISWLDWNRLTEYQEIHDFFRYMIAFRKKYAIVRKQTKGASCGFPEISIHNGYPWNGGTDYTTRLIGIMYAGRDEADTRDDIVFYGMNAYWEPLDMQLPNLPEGMKWKVCVNTFVEYEDGKDIESQTAFSHDSRLKVPPRTVVVLVAE